MVAEEFVHAKRQSWERLQHLIRAAQSNIAALSAEELQELGRLYRQATSDLAVARRDYAGHNVTIFLNTLVAQGHASIYRGRSTSLSQIWRYFAVMIPRTFRETWLFTLISFLTMMLPALVCFVLTLRSPEAATQLGYGGMVADMQTKTEWWKELNEMGNATGAGMLMTHNIQVSIFAFAGGMLVGIPTFWVLYQNGVMLGVVSGASIALDFDDRVFGFIAAHGTLELSMIFLSGGAGLQLAWAILHPGLLTRRNALTVAGRRTAILMGLVVLLLVVAGIIEGFISPSDLPLWFKYGVSLVSGILLYAYLLLAGRERAPATRSDALRVEQAPAEPAPAPQQPSTSS